MTSPTIYLATKARSLESYSREEGFVNSSSVSNLKKYSYFSLILFEMSLWNQKGWDNNSSILRLRLMGGRGRDGENLQGNGDDLLFELYVQRISGDGVWAIHIPWEVRKLNDKQTY